MFFRARGARSPAPTSDFDDPDLDYEAPPALDVGERICAPSSDDGGSGMLGATVVIFLMLGAGWAVTQAPAELLAVFGERVAAAAAFLRRAPPPSVSSEPSTIVSVDATLTAAPMTEKQVTQPPPLSGEPVADAPTDQPLETASIDPAAAAPADAPLPPPRVDPADPYQKRAVAVGLHPDLSRVLLRRMTSADYRNAAVAIDTALAKTADDADFVWPRQRKPEQALFRVHFVRGAAAHCRRYVVTVVKDGWTTTAPPMERCGADAGDKRSG